jgi:Ca2+ transporting ATPase
MSNSILLNLSIVLNNNFEVSDGLELDKSAFEFFIQNYKDETFKVMKDSQQIIYDRINFNSIRKKMTTIIKLGKGKYRIFSKGAAEYILDVCSNFINYRKNSSEMLSEANKQLIHLNIEKFASMSYRLIGIAYKDVWEAEIKNFRDNHIDEESDSYNFEKNGFHFLGLLCFKDGIRPGVPEAVLKCQNAGIKVIMITGDNQASAVAIAQECNILNSINFSHDRQKANDNSFRITNNHNISNNNLNRNDHSNLEINNNNFDNSNKNCLTGVEFYTRIGGLICETCSFQIENCKCPITAQEAKKAGLPESSIRKDKIGSISSFKKIIKSFRVIARSRPLDKYCLVKGLKELQHVVAVTGDGTNDAMALSKSDVGFAMGINGTDIAKNASDIILLDDNFASIINAIKWGRGIFENIRKFIQFQLSVNISAVLLVFFSSCVGSESPITAIQMLWLNMIMDSLGSLCLATEEPHEELLNRKPYSKREYIINSRMWKHIVFQALFQFSIVFILYLYAPRFIQENNEERIFINNQLEKCFGKIPPLKVDFEHHKLTHYILDGKKSMWDSLKQIKRNLDKDFCFFYDFEKFEGEKIKNLKQAYKWIITKYGSTVHMTIIFNTFVLYSLFNQLNSRILDDSFNIFANLHKNFIFVFIILAEITFQYFIVQYGGLIFNCVYGGLTKQQWIICVSIASSSMIISLLLKCTKLEKIFEFNYITKLKSIFLRGGNETEKEQFVEMVDNSDDYIREK